MVIQKLYNGVCASILGILRSGSVATDMLSYMSDYITIILLFPVER